MVLETLAAAAGADPPLSVSFFTFLEQSAASAVTHRPASQQGGARLQYRHISTHQFFHGIRLRPFVPKGRGHLSWWTTETG